MAPDTLHPGTQGPSNTPMSLNPVKFQALSSADFLCQIGAVVWHAKSRKFLVYLRKEGRDSLPIRSANGDLALLLLDPLAFVTREAGYTIERLPLCKYDRRFRSPESGKFQPIAVLSEPREVSIDPFIVTTKMLWTPDTQPGQHAQSSSTWSQLRQFVTFWFAGVIVDENPPAIAPRKPDPSTVATHTCHLIHADDAFREFRDQKIDGEVDYEVLGTFFDLWYDTYPRDRSVAAYSAFRTGWRRLKRKPNSTHLVTAVSH